MQWRMPSVADQQDDFEGQDDGTGNTSDGADGGSQSTGAAEDGGTQQGNSDGDDALRRLQSERDKETARANKLAKQLETLQKQATSAKDENATEVPPQVQQWITAAQQNAREALYKADGRLERYGVDPSLIRGDTPAEMQASAKALGDAMDKMERDIRDSVLQEHGFTPAPRDASSMGTKNFRTMDSKEFEALVDEALRG
jgi:hypothetical protein